MFEELNDGQKKYWLEFLERAEERSQLLLLSIAFSGRNFPEIDAILKKARLLEEKAGEYIHRN